MQNISLFLGISNNWVIFNYNLMSVRLVELLEGRYL